MDTERILVLIGIIFFILIIIFGICSTFTEDQANQDARLELCNSVNGILTFKEDACVVGDTMWQIVDVGKLYQPKYKLVKYA